MSNEPDYVGAGFHRLDEKALVARPPKIDWGRGFKEMPDAEKVDYLEKLAVTMNHAAKLIQDERDELGALAEAKESQLIQMQKNMEANNQMLQQQVMQFNNQRQHYAAHVSELTAKIKELENGDHD